MKWQEPPAKLHAVGAQKRIKWATEADELKSSANRWAVLCAKPTSRAATAAAHQIQRGDLRAFRPAGSFEATARGCDVYVRYVGPA